MRKKSKGGKNDDLRPQYNLRQLLRTGVQGKYAKRYRQGTNLKKLLATEGAGPLGEWARGFSLLSDSTRLGIMRMLAGGPKKVRALCNGLGLTQPTISHHLGLLRMGRLVVGTRKGKSVVYVSDAMSTKELAAAIAKLTRGR